MICQSVLFLADIGIGDPAWRSPSGVTLIMIANLGEKNKMLQNIFHNKSKNMYSARTHVRRPPYAGFLPAVGLFSGLLNGFFGTGGGMVLSVGLRAAYPGEDQESMALATASMMILSVLSTILYATSGHIGSNEILPVILPAVLGGLFGSLALGKIRHDVLDRKSVV